MVELPAHLARLSPEQRRDALKQLLEQQAREPRYYPLSAGQRTLWFLHYIGAERSSQNFPLALRTLGPVEVPILKQALQDLVRRHSVLRTTYELRAGEPLQRVDPGGEAAFETVDAVGWSESELRSRVSGHAFREFDLESGPVFRTTLFQRPDGDQVLLFAWHHIAFDGWSLVIALGELSHLYGRRRRGLAADLPAAPPYNEFVEWQQRQSETDEWKSDSRYWRTILGGDLPRLRLPADHVTPPTDSEHAGALSFEVDEQLTSKLHKLAQDEGTTLFTVLLAACQILLHCYSGQEHVMVRVPTTGRTSHRFEGSLGYFVNQVVLRGEVRGELTFHSLLSQMRQRVHEALDHQDYPLSLLLEDLPPSPEPGLSRFTGVMFILQKIPGVSRESEARDFSREASDFQREDSKGDFGGVPIKGFPLAPHASGFELDFQVLDVGTKLVGIVLYRRSLFEQATVQRWAHHLRTLLERIAEDPQCLISGLCTPPDEQVRLLDLWNQTDKRFPEVRIAALFEEQVRKTPDAVAVQSADRQLSYQELHERSDRLAARLQGSSRGSESPIGVFLPRSLDFVLAIVGVRKAGCPYVPLDPSLPSLEVNRILEDTNPPLVLTTRELRDRLPPTDATILAIDDDLCLDAPVAPDQPPRSENDSLMYVLYTSGSTGPPKGVMGAEDATLNRLHWMWDQYPYEQGEVACLTSSPGFVDSVTSVFGPLLKGIPLIVADQETLLDTECFLDFLAAHRVTRLTVVPSLLRLLLGRGQPLGARVGALRYCVCSGDSLPGSLARDFLKEAPGVTLLNLYGCSEAGGDSTCYEMSEGWDLDRTPIGRPIANTRVHILDGRGRRLPIGVPGEIAIAGKGLARGYWRQPQLSGERFVSLPGSSETLVYRTGDRGRHLHDGTIEFLGRLDRQIRIRGQRVEPSEIEAVLASHPGVSQAFVTTWAGSDGEERLITYVVPRSSRTVTAGEIRTHATVRLAEAKVPSAYIFVDELPLSVNGKLDALRLPDPSEALARQSEASLPRNPVEQVVAAVWRDILGFPELGIHSHFFELGGHSLLATRAVSRLREILRTDIPLRLIFLHPTVAALSAALIEMPERRGIEQVAAAVIEVSDLSEDEVKARLRASPQRTTE